MGTINDMTHIKTMLSFSPGTGKNFIGNALCSSDNIILLIHILQFSTIKKTPRNKNSEESNLVKEGARE
jgi:hypothetical protein